MADFSSLFEESEGKPVEYKGKTLYHSDRFPVTSGERLRITFESWDSEWKQGIGLASTDKKPLTINGEKLKRHVALMEGDVPKVFEFTIKTKGKDLIVYNAWLMDGTLRYGYYGSAMIVEEIPNGRRYRCNDWEPDEDFNDLIFTIEHIPQPDAVEDKDGK